MNYDETIEKIHSFQRFGSKLGLERMSVLMEILGNPQDKMKIIHVAGTNGKGSVCRYLAAMLKENGYKVGLYTSPYLQRFTERIEFDGTEISKKDLAICAKEVFAGVETMLASGYESPTEFELVTAIGFVYFSKKPIDFLILEVGLGGRGDSTNIIKQPLATVFTSISYDHMNVLGNTLTDIAREKAGIIKEGCPVISNVDDSDASQVIESKASEKKCFFYDATKIRIKDVTKSLQGYSFTITGDGNKGLQRSSIDKSLFNNKVEPVRVELSMIGMHQISNAICALSVIEVLAGKGIIAYEADKLLTGIKKAVQKGRLEILHKEPTIIVDGAHNIAGVKALTQVLRDHFSGKKLLLVVGVLAEKDVTPMVKELCTIDADFIATEPENPRKLPVSELSRVFRNNGCKCGVSDSWEDAHDLIKTQMLNYDAVIVTGSLYLIGRLRGRFKDEQSSSCV